MELAHCFSVNIRCFIQGIYLKYQSEVFIVNLWCSGGQALGVMVIKRFQKCECEVSLGYIDPVSKKTKS